MTNSDVKTILNSSGVPFAYNFWKTPPAMPYGAFYSPGTNNFGADNKVYFTATKWRAELYTGKKEPAQEQKIIDALNTAGIYWEIISTAYIDTEKMHLVIFEFEG